ncbi:hypothetical protein F442_05477 [Phytophthora nicotianae P10297]|uniref:Uncharacterized protein n=1 Tax=Phytophthora nicotianae P10297 TaxID=1317064 RepID=W2ZPJ2_PHYNI|nr:hypothetical protein F442_05477 [Phytophthora nicotianae P10297]
MCGKRLATSDQRPSSGSEYLAAVLPGKTFVYLLVKSLAPPRRQNFSSAGADSVDLPRVQRVLTSGQQKRAQR